MRRNEHVGARVLAVTGLVGGAAYLSWRLYASMDGAPAWLALPLYAVELLGFIAAVALVWALWPMPTTRGEHDRRTRSAPVDAVVRIDAQPLHELRATLLALRSVDGIEDVVVVDHSGRAEVATMSLEFQVVYAATDPDDRNGLRVAHAAVRTPEFLLLDAGDVPTPDIVARLCRDLADLDVAVVQGLGITVADDSPEHGPDRRHELVFERGALNPALGRRGVAIWLGSGSLVRTAALADITIGFEPALEAGWDITSQLHAGGWRITAPADVPVLAHRAVRDPDAVYCDRVRRVRAARRMLFAPRGAFRVSSHTLTQRLAAFAWAVRPLSSLRRIAFIAVLCSALVAGEVPFHGGVATLAILWLPYFVYVPLSLALLSGWILRPGDRTRWSLHNIGATLSSGVDPDRARDRAPIVNLPSSQYGASLVAAVVVLSVVLVMRGISDRLTHSMGVLPQSALLAMVTVALWLLALALDSLRVLGRRSHRRRATRVGAALSASLGERAVSLLDLTSFGAGVMSHAGFDVGEEVVLETAVPTRTGVTTIQVPAVVRNVTLMPLGEWRLGVEFRALDDATANALAEYCIIEPVWEQMGVMPGTSVVEARPMITEVSAPPAENTAGAGRMAMRAVSLLALVGAIASSLPARAEASALSPRWSGAVVAEGEALPGVTVTAVCADGVPHSATTSAEGRFTLVLTGDRCRGFVAPPDGFRLAQESSAATVVLEKGAVAQPGDGTGSGTATEQGVLVAQVLSVGKASDAQLRATLSLVVLALIAVIAGSLLVGLHRPKRLAIA